MYKSRFFLVPTLFILLLLLFPTRVSAEPTNDLALLKEHLSEVLGSVADKEKDLQLLDGEISLNLVKASLLEEDLVETNLKIKETETELKKLDLVMSDRIRSYYVCFGSSLDYLEFLFGSKSISEIFKRQEYLRLLNKSDRELISEIDEAKLDLEFNLEELEKSKYELDTTIRTLKLKISSSEKMLKDLNQNKDNLILQINLNEERVVAPLISLIDSTSSREGLVALKNSLDAVNYGIMSSLIKEQVDLALSRINLKLLALSSGPLSTPIFVESDVVNESYKYLGIPYVWGGTDPSVGLDCSGLTQLCYRNLGYNLSRTTYTQVYEGDSVPVSLDSLRAGDLLFFGDPKAPHHVALYVKDNYYIHAPHTGDVVKISSGALKASCARRIIKE